jgi:hypothetical protein
MDVDERLAGMEICFGGEDEAGKCRDGWVKEMLLDCGESITETAGPGMGLRPSR